MYKCRTGRLFSTQYRVQSCDAVNLVEICKRFGESYCQKIKGRRDDPEYVKYIKNSLKYC
jgi:hypothetical protein